MKVDEIKFTPDQAFQIILKGMETGQIKLPFNKTIKAEEMEAVAKEAMARHQYSEDVDVFSVTHALARSARLDSLYLFCLYASLTRGLTERDVEHLIRLFDSYSN